MAVIGNAAATNFQTIRKQTITGTGATAYALDYAVSGPNDLEVFVNNVRQEPTAAYTASGQTITFSDAVDSADSAYIIYQGQTVGSVIHPADQPLRATTGTFTSNVGVSGTSTLTGNVGVGAAPTRMLSVQGAGAEFSLYDTNGTADNRVLNAFIDNGKATLRMLNDAQSAGTTALQFDTAGRVMMPYQPAFQVKLSASQSLSSGVRTKIDFNSLDYANGNDYNTTDKRFTAPVTGWYQFNCWAYAYTVSNNELNLYKNGSLYFRSQWAAGSSINNVNSHLSVVTKLTANDYVEMWASVVGAGQLYSSGDRPTVWSGILIG